MYLFIDPIDSKCTNVCKVVFGTIKPEETKGKTTGLCPHRACGREIQIQYLQTLGQLGKKEIG